MKARFEVSDLADLADPGASDHRHHASSVATSAEPSHLPQFLTLTEAAEVLQIHTKTAYDWALKRKLPGAFRLPAGTWRVSRDGLLRYVRENRVTSPGESER
jgi:excisionase family DNA binding protein